LGKSTDISTEGVEYAHLQVRVAVHYRRRYISAAHIHVVHQQTYPYSPIGGLEQLVAEQSAYEIIVIQVILHIQATFRIMGQHGTGHEGIQAVCQQMES
jgi:hypothetical protein